MTDGPVNGEEVVATTYCVVEAGDFVQFLKRAREGEDPEMLMMEFLANSDSESVEGEG